MNSKNPVEELAQIRSMMERSSRFLSLSGLSGLLAGFFGLMGSIVVHFVLQFEPASWSDTPNVYPTSFLILVGFGVLSGSLVATALLSWRKAQKASQSLWTAGTRLLLAQISIPLLTGGMVVLSFYALGLYGLMAPFSLIFYGLALWIGGRFTFDELNYLGSLQISLGLLSLWFLPFSIWIWGIGFGLFHMIYGVYLHLKYE